MMTSSSTTYRLAGGPLDGETLRITTPATMPPRSAVLMLNLDDTCSHVYENVPATEDSRENVMRYDGTGPLEPGEEQP
jgi:hypothetical protein